MALGLYEKVRRDNLIRRILLICLVILLIYVTEGIGKMNFQEDKLGNTTGNLKNYGLVATDGEWEYFWAGTTLDWKDEGALCKMRPDGSEFYVLSDDTPCYINIVDDWIYYIKNQKPVYNYRGEIYRIKKDGTNRERLINSVSKDMVVVNDWIFFINIDDGNSIYKCKKDGSQITRVIDKKCFGLQYENGHIYYISETDPKKFSLFRHNISLNESSVKILDEIDDYIVYNGYIFGSNENNGIFRVKTDGTSYSKIFSKPIGSFSIHDGYIYCSSVDAEYFVKGKGRSNYIYKMNLDGKEQTILPNKDVFNRYTVVGIVGDYIYYWLDCAEWLELARMKADGTGDEVLVDKLRNIRSN